MEERIRQRAGLHQPGTSSSPPPAARVACAIFAGLNGGPGASSFGYGYLTELGPFYVSSKNVSANPAAWQKLEENPKAWTTVRASLPRLRDLRHPVSREHSREFCLAFLLAPGWAGRECDLPRVPVECRLLLLRREADGGARGAADGSMLLDRHVHRQAQLRRSAGVLRQVPGVPNQPVLHLGRELCRSALLAFGGTKRAKRIASRWHVPRQARDTPEQN
jgi:hypothetical protein